MNCNFFLSIAKIFPVANDISVRPISKKQRPILDSNGWKWRVKKSASITPFADHLGENDIHFREV